MQEASIRNRIARGESKHGTKLHDVDIPRIFSMREQGMTYAAIAKEFGVNSITIGDILTYRSWMHISKNLGSYAMEEKRYNSKLTEGKILLIRQRYADGETQAAIAADLGISRPNISMIVNRKTWNHIP
jgi:DNA invertase Pin-like site-specific DNA recombinase